MGSLETVVLFDQNHKVCMRSEISSGLLVRMQSRVERNQESRTPIYIGGVLTLRLAGNVQVHKPHSAFVMEPIEPERSLQTQYRLQAATCSAQEIGDLLCVHHHRIEQDKWVVFI